MALAFLTMGEGWRTLVDLCAGNTARIRSFVAETGYRPRDRRDVRAWRALEVYLDGVAYAQERLGEGWIAAVRAANQAQPLPPVVDDMVANPRLMEMWIPLPELEEDQVGDSEYSELRFP